MPKKVHDMAKALMREGYDEDSAWAIANSKKKKKGKKSTAKASRGRKTKRMR